MYNNGRKDVLRGMQAKEVAETLGITQNRIKYFKRQGVFKPEKHYSGCKNTDYTAKDIEELKQLIILTKIGLTCSDIKKMQNGIWTLEVALQERYKSNEQAQKRMYASKDLAQRLFKGRDLNEPFDTDAYWEMLTTSKSEMSEFTEALASQK